MNILDIINGHVKNILNLNEDISLNRLKICHKCPLYSNKFGGICNNKLWMNPDTLEVSTEKKAGYKRGCGCLVIPKTSNVNSKCPLNKW